MDTGQQMLIGSGLMDLCLISISWVVAGVVSTCMSKWGVSSSQVSVTCTDVTCPHRAVFDTQVRFWIVGRGNGDGGWRNVVVGAPVDVVLTHVELLHPHPPQHLDRWDAGATRQGRGFR